MERSRQVVTFTEDQNVLSKPSDTTFPFENGTLQN